MSALIGDDNFLSSRPSLDQVTNPHFQIYHGIDSIKHFDDFSVELVISEVEPQAPDVLRLLSFLGRAPSLTDEPRVNDMPTVAALCSIVKGRSEKVMGIQLLVSIAHSTNRQASNTVLYYCVAQ